MPSFMTVLIPGLSQLRAGQPGKAATIFVASFLAAVVTGGIGWLLGGLWSLADARALASPAPGARPGAAPGPAANGGGAGPWIFKFAVLGVGSAIALYSISQGRALQSLKFLGIEMSFESSIAGGGGVAQADVSGGAPASTFRPVSAAPSPEAAPPTEVAVPEYVPDYVPDAAPPAYAPEIADVSGTWASPEGAEYHVVQTGDQVQIREMSRVFYVPVESAACEGTVSGTTITAQCVTFTGSSGYAQLSLQDGGQALSGVYQDVVTGMQTSLYLYRN